jgi:site-specific DNA recombinase
MTFSSHPIENLSTTDTAALHLFDRPWNACAILPPPGAIQRIYVHSPDRLARSYAYQVVLLDERRRYGIEVVFLNKAIGQSPEDDLLLQVQGVVAEYEHAKIMERCLRGKRHAARTGNVDVMSCAPYGYRYLFAGGRWRCPIRTDSGASTRRAPDLHLGWT